MDYEKKMREELEKLNHRKDMRRAAKEANEEGPGSSMVGEIAAGTIAHWAEQILQEFFGSSQYGYTITATKQDRVVLSGMTRDPPVLVKDTFYDYQSEVGYAESPNLREYKNRAADWFEDKAVEAAADARKRILSFEQNHPEM